MKDRFNLQISYWVFGLWSCRSGNPEDQQVWLSWPAEHDTCMAECASIEVISLPSLTLPSFLFLSVRAYLSFVVQTIMAAIKEARWKEVSVLTSVHLSSPHFLCLSLSLWFHSLLLNNKQSGAPVFTSHGPYLCLHKMIMKLMLMFGNSPSVYIRTVIFPMIFTSNQR